MRIKIKNISSPGSQLNFMNEEICEVVGVNKQGDFKLVFKNREIKNIVHGICWPHNIVDQFDEGDGIKFDLCLGSQNCEEYKELKEKLDEVINGR